MTKARRDCIVTSLGLSTLTVEVGVLGLVLVSACYQYILWPQCTNVAAFISNVLECYQFNQECGV